MKQIIYGVILLMSMTAVAEPILPAGREILDGEVTFDYQAFGEYFHNTAEPVTFTAGDKSITCKVAQIELDSMEDTEVHEDSILTKPDNPDSEWHQDACMGLFLYEGMHVSMLLENQGKPFAGYTDIDETEDEFVKLKKISGLYREFAGALFYIDKKAFLKSETFQAFLGR